MKEFKEYGGSRGDEPVRRTRTQRTAPYLRKRGESNAAEAPSERTVARLRKRGESNAAEAPSERTVARLRKRGESNAAKAPSERTAPYLRKPGESNAAKAPSKFENFARVQMAAAFKGTFTAIIKHAVQLLADAHGLGVLVRSMDGRWKVSNGCRSWRVIVR